MVTNTAILAIFKELYVHAVYTVDLLLCEDFGGMVIFGKVFGKFGA